MRTRIRTLAALALAALALAASAATAIADGSWPPIPK
ncbi:MAG: hypothetical protein QOH61_1236 [Chloroflexota bacterium]|jgi:hypothetical protein|nr:hypothetical protein [Chloroflexota bacterium]